MQTVSAAGHPLPGTCYSVVLRLQGTEAPGLAQIDLSVLRGGVFVVEICDAADGRLDGVLTVDGAVATLEQEIATVLAPSAAPPGLVQRLDGLTLTIDLIETRSPDAEGGVVGNRPLPPVTMTLSDLVRGERVRVVYGASDPPITRSSRETPPASDGTGGVD